MATDSPLVRALGTGVTAAAVFLALLVVLEGITPRSIAAALKSPPAR
jgi:hypothetical protein